MLLSSTAFSNVANTEHSVQAESVCAFILFCFYPHHTFDLFLCFEDLHHSFQNCKFLVLHVNRNILSYDIINGKCKKT